MTQYHDIRQKEQQWEDVDDYLTGLFVPDDPALTETLKSSDAAGLPQIAVSANQGKLLMILAKSCGAKSILEIGTLGGYSTIWLGRALPAGGKLISLEYSEKHAEVARKNIARAGLENRVEVRIGAAVESLPKLASERLEFDFIFIDADKQGYCDYLDWSLKLTHPGSLIVADNVVRDGQVVDPNSQDEMVQGIQRFNKKLAAEKRVDASAIQTVGSKGYDGLAFAVVK
jgi:predicted O-methyltransferase YrrM